MFGFLNLNKPAGWTSHDCVAKVRRILKTQKIGHGGTLDPSATGVLPIAVGKATRLLQFLPENKAYHAKICLGVKTNTDDLEGEVLERIDGSHITLDDIKLHLTKFEGEIQQIPPAYSAIQVGGKRLYQLARQGEIVEVPVRTVKINKIEILNFIAGEFPQLEIAVVCGAGTYIRAIARDLGYLLGIGGTLAALRRTESCGMQIADSVTLEQLEEGNISLIAPSYLLNHLSFIILEDLQIKSYLQGQRFLVAPDKITPKITEENQPVAIYQLDGTLLGVAKTENLDEQVLIMPQVVYFL